MNLNVTQLFGLTVASMGNFESEKGLKREMYFQNGEYAALYREEGLPVGAIVAGSPRLVNLLGYLRPHINYYKIFELSLEQLIVRFS